MTGFRVSKEEIADLKTAFYTVLDRDDTGLVLLSRLQTERESLARLPNWLMADCIAHLFRSYGRFYHVANRRTSNFQFVDCQLTQHQKDAFKAMEDDVDTLYAHIPALLQAGYKLTTSWNGMRGSFCATLIAPDTSKNANRGLSAFAGDIFTAMRLVVFKHTYILDGDWSKTVNPAPDDLLG